MRFIPSKRGYPKIGNLQKSMRFIPSKMNMNSTNQQLTRLNSAKTKLVLKTLIF